MANVAPGIITMGLGGAATNMIIGFPFSLGFIDITIGSPVIPPVEPPVTPPANRGRHGGGAGARPYDDNKDVWPDQTEREEELFRTVTIRVKLGDKTTEKIYLVRKHRADALVKVVDITNATGKRIKVAVNSMKTKASQIMTKVTNMRKKRK